MHEDSISREKKLLEDNRLANEVIETSLRLFSMPPSQGEMIKSALGDSSTRIRYEAELPPPLPSKIRLDEVFVPGSEDFSCRLSFFSQAPEHQKTVPSENTLFILKKGELASVHFNFRISDETISISSSLSSRPDVSHLPTVLMLLSHELIRAVINKYPAIFKGKTVTSVIEDISWDKKASYQQKSGWGSRRAAELGYDKQDDNTWTYHYQ